MLQRSAGATAGAPCTTPGTCSCGRALFASMPRWQRAILSRVEGRWARACDAVIQVSEPYAAMMERDLGLRDVARRAQLPRPLGPARAAARPASGRRWASPPDTRIVLYQGLLIADRGIEQAMDAILEVPDAVLVLMGFGNQNGSADLDAIPRQGPMYAGKCPSSSTPCRPPELLTWSASADIRSCCSSPPPRTTSTSRPRSCGRRWPPACPVVASDLPGFASVVEPSRVRHAVRPDRPRRHRADAFGEMLALGPDGLRSDGRAGASPRRTTDLQLGASSSRCSTGSMRGSSPSPREPMADADRPRPASRSCRTARASSTRAPSASRAPGPRAATRSRSTRDTSPGCRARRSSTAIASCASPSTMPTPASPSARSGARAAGDGGPPSAASASTHPRAPVRAGPHAGCPRARLIRHRFRQFPQRPLQRAPWFVRQVEPHDIWHGMWAGSLPALEQVRAAPRRSHRVRRPGRVPALPHVRPHAPLAAHASSRATRAAGRRPPTRWSRCRRSTPR